MARLACVIGLMRRDIYIVVVVVVVVVVIVVVIEVAVEVNTILQIIVGTCWNTGVSVLGRPLSVVKVS